MLPITLTGGIFHLRESLWRGLGTLLTILGVLGLSVIVFWPPERRRPLAIIAGFTILWYLGHEMSPLKPYPDFARYMVPIAPLLVILGAAFVHHWAERYRLGIGAPASIVVLLALQHPLVGNRFKSMFERMTIHGVHCPKSWQIRPTTLRSIATLGIK